MADPYGNYLANLSPFAGPGLQPLGLSPEDMANLGITKPGMDPGLSSIVGRIGAELAVPMAVSSVTNASRLGEAGMAGIIPGARPMSTDEMIPAVAKATMDMAMRGVAHAPEGLGSMGGRLAAGWDEAAARKYQDMVSQGYSPKQAYQETGIFQTADQVPKFNIPDVTSSLTNSAANKLTRYAPGTEVKGRLSEFLNHPQLYENYPDMAGLETTLKLMPPRPGGAMNYEGLYRPDKKSIDAASSYLEGPNGIQSVLLHEGQHHIGYPEGFAVGSSPAYEKDLGKDFLRRIQSQINQLHNEWGPNTVPDPADLSALQRLRQMQLDFKKNFKPFDAYQRSAGEVDARTVQTAMGMTPWELNKHSPADIAALLVPFDKQIVRFPSKW